MFSAEYFLPLKKDILKQLLCFYTESWAGFLFPFVFVLTTPSKPAATSALQNAASRIHASKKQPSCTALVFLAF